MKKLLIAFILVLVLAIICIYIFIPNTLTVTSVAVVESPSDGISRTIANKDNWKHFWVNKNDANPSPSFSNNCFIYNKDTLTVTEMFHGGLRIRLAEGDDIQQTQLSIIPVSKSATALNWSYTTPTSKNPFVRITQYYQAVDNKKTMTDALIQMRTYLSRTENIYGGLSVQETSTTDTSLISVNKKFKYYPSTKEIYSLIDQLHRFANANNARVLNYPYLNVTLVDSQYYRVMVALSVDKKLSPTNEISFKKMIPGNFLTTTVTGGEKSIENAYNNMGLYFNDYKRVAMAIPFQVLLINRLQQPDTSKWVTKLFFPVM